jgi:predicted nicotinamide N-methyase
MTTQLVNSYYCVVMMAIEDKTSKHKMSKETMSSYRAASVFYVYFFVYHYGLPDAIPVVNSLSAPLMQTQPPSNNPDVLRSYVFGDEARCWEVLSPSMLPYQDEEEDEVEYWYPTRKRYFEFSIPSSSVIGSTTSATTTIRQTSFGCGKLGAEVWDSSVALCLYLGGEQSLVEGKRILELGSGCGLPSVVCRDELKADAVLATDFWEIENDDFDGDRLVPTKFHGLNLEYNVMINSSNKNDDKDNNVETAVQRLDWHDRVSALSAKDSFRPDLVIGSDLVYYPMDVEPLLNILELLLVGDVTTNEGPSSPIAGERKTRAVLALPLSPAKREALPEFRSKLPARFSQTHTVEMEERDLIREDTDGENSTHLIIDIIPK